MSKTQELKKLLKTLNSLYEAACASEDVQLTEVEIINHWIPVNNFPNQKKLDKQEVVLHYTLIRPQYERP